MWEPLAIVVTMGIMQLDDHGWILDLLLSRRLKKLYFFVIPLFMGESFESLLNSYFVQGNVVPLFPVLV